ncbi:MAG: iron-only hydrogenase system regulator [Oscillospiraceae bacterium]|nr:iron-only hydrogenase system regulator [Oscillospiraceae bacterium]
METRVAIIGIIITNPEQIGRLNSVLHEYGDYIIGRMGIPYRQKNIHIISVAVDAPQNIINTLSGKIGRLDGISAKTAYSDVISKPDT